VQGGLSSNAKILGSCCFPIQLAAFMQVRDFSVLSLSVQVQKLQRMDHLTR
jgi:hypothetical protein